MSIAQNWGTLASERSGAWPCDSLAPAGAFALYRGVDAAAPAASVFRWLCQLRVAPYSYDWIDNRGRRSPPRLTPGLEVLEPGQTLMSIFRLESFVKDEHLTLRTGTAEGLFGQVLVTYRVVPAGDEHCRLLAKLLCVPPRGWLGPLVRALLPWGDLVMMRKQLLTLAAYAARDHRESRSRASQSAA